MTSPFRGADAATIFIPEGYTIIPVFDLINRLHLNEGVRLILSNLLLRRFHARRPWPYRHG